MNPFYESHNHDDDMHPDDADTDTTNTATLLSSNDNVGGGANAPQQQPLPSLSLPHMPQSFHEALQMIMQLHRRQPNTTRNTKPTFVQIGANDGRTNDPLYHALVHNATRLDLRHEWIGLQVEPTRTLYESLFTINSPNDWYYYNGVIAPSLSTTTSNTNNTSVCVNGTISYCETITPGVGDWKTQGQTNSISLDRCLDSTIYNTSNHRIVTHPCVSSYIDLLNHAVVAPTATTSESLPSAMSIFGSSLDVLQVDTEGYDLQIIELFLQQVQPLCIHYEAWGVDMDAAIDLLQNQYGYTIHTPSGSDNRLACRVMAVDLVDVANPNNNVTTDDTDMSILMTTG